MMAEKSLSNLLAKYSSQPIDAFKDEDKFNEEIQQCGNRIQSYSDDGVYNNQIAEDDYDIEEIYDILLNQQPQVLILKEQEKLKKSQSNQWKESARKIFTPAKPKKQKKQKKPKIQFHNPYNSSQYFIGQKQKIVNQIKQSMTRNDELNEQALKFGMKNTKALGSVRTKKQMQNFINYLEIGQLPQQYLLKFQALIAN